MWLASCRKGGALDNISWHGRLNRRTFGCRLAVTDPDLGSQYLPPVGALYIRTPHFRLLPPHLRVFPTPPIQRVMELDFQIHTSWCIGCSMQILPKRSCTPLPQQLQPRLGMPRVKRRRGILSEPLRLPSSPTYHSFSPRALRQHSGTVVGIRSDQILFCLFMSCSLVDPLSSAISGRGYCGCSHDRQNSSPLDQVPVPGLGVDVVAPPKENHVQLPTTPNHHWTSSLGTRISDFSRHLFKTKPSF